MFFSPINQQGEYIVHCISSSDTVYNTAAGRKGSADKQLESMQHLSLSGTFVLSLLEATLNTLHPGQCTQEILGFDALTPAGRICGPENRGRVELSPAECSTCPERPRCVKHRLQPKGL